MRRHGCDAGINPRLEIRNRIVVGGRNPPA